LPKKAKKTNFIWPFFKNKKAKAVKKGKKLQSWPQQSQTGSPVVHLPLKTLQHSHNMAERRTVTKLL